MPETDPVTEAVTYHYPDEFTDILLNGDSILALQPIEAKVYPDGWGYVMCLRTFETVEKEPKKLIDGQHLTHTYYGYIQVIP